MVELADFLIQAGVSGRDEVVEALQKIMRTSVEQGHLGKLATETNRKHVLRQQMIRTVNRSLAEQSQKSCELTKHLADTQEQYRDSLARRLAIAQAKNAAITDSLLRAESLSTTLQGQVKSVSQNLADTKRVRDLAINAIRRQSSCVKKAQSTQEAIAKQYSRLGSQMKMATNKKKSLIQLLTRLQSLEKVRHESLQVYRNAIRVLQKDHAKDLSRYQEAEERNLRLGSEMMENKVRAHETEQKLNRHLLDLEENVELEKLRRQALVRKHQDIFKRRKNLIADFVAGEESRFESLQNLTENVQEANIQVNKLFDAKRERLWELEKENDIKAAELSLTQKKTTDLLHVLEGLSSSCNTLRARLEQNERGYEKVRQSKDAEILRAREKTGSSVNHCKELINGYKSMCKSILDGLARCKNFNKDAEERNFRLSSELVENKVQAHETEQRLNGHLLKLEEGIELEKSRRQTLVKRHQDIFKRRRNLTANFIVGEKGRSDSMRDLIGKVQEANTQVNKLLGVKRRKLRELEKDKDAKATESSLAQKKITNLLHVLEGFFSSRATLQARLEQNKRGYEKILRSKDVDILRAREKTESSIEHCKDLIDRHKSMYSLIFCGLVRCKNFNKEVAERFSTTQKTHSSLKMNIYKGLQVCRNIQLAKMRCGTNDIRKQVGQLESMVQINARKDQMIAQEEAKYKAAVERFVQQEELFKQEQSMNNFLQNQSSAEMAQYIRHGSSKLIDIKAFAAQSHNRSASLIHALMEKLDLIEAKCHAIQENSQLQKYDSDHAEKDIAAKERLYDAIRYLHQQIRTLQMACISNLAKYINATAVLKDLRDNSLDKFKSLENHREFLERSKIFVSNLAPALVRILSIKMNQGNDARIILHEESKGKNHPLADLTTGLEKSRSLIMQQSKAMAGLVKRIYQYRSRIPVEINMIREYQQRTRTGIAVFSNLQSAFKHDCMVKRRKMEVSGRIAITGQLREQLCERNLFAQRILRILRMYRRKSALLRSRIDQLEIKYLQTSASTRNRVHEFAGKLTEYRERLARGQSLQKIRWRVVIKHLLSKNTQIHGEKLRLEKMLEPILRHWRSKGETVKTASPRQNSKMLRETYEFKTILAKFNKNTEMTSKCRDICKGLLSFAELHKKGTKGVEKMYEDAVSSASRIRSPMLHVDEADLSKTPCADDQLNQLEVKRSLAQVSIKSSNMREKLHEMRILHVEVCRRLKATRPTNAGHLQPTELTIATLSQYCKQLLSELSDTEAELIQAYNFIRIKLKEDHMDGIPKRYRSRAISDTFKDELVWLQRLQSSPKIGVQDTISDTAAPFADKNGTGETERPKIEYEVYKTKEPKHHADKSKCYLIN